MSSENQAVVKDARYERQVALARKRIEERIALDPSLVRLQGRIDQIKRRLTGQPVFRVMRAEYGSTGDYLAEWKVFYDGRIEGFPEATETEGMLISNLLSVIWDLGFLEGQLQSHLIADGAEIEDLIQQVQALDRMPLQGTPEELLRHLDILRQTCRIALANSQGKTCEDILRAMIVPSAETMAKRLEPILRDRISPSPKPTEPPVAEV